MGGRGSGTAGAAGLMAIRMLTNELSGQNEKSMRTLRIGIDMYAQGLQNSHQKTMDAGLDFMSRAASEMGSERMRLEINRLYWK